MYLFYHSIDHYLFYGEAKKLTITSLKTFVAISKLEIYKGTAYAHMYIGSNEVNFLLVQN
jgi:hypothetical protein